MVAPMSHQYPKCRQDPDNPYTAKYVSAGRPGFGRSLLLAGMATLVCSLSALFAVSSSASPYGEVGRIGGYDASGAVGGKFVLPVGFAVDGEEAATSDGNAIFVLDRTKSVSESGELEYRLQKLTSAGVVLGSTQFSLPAYTDSFEASDAHPLI